MGIHQSRVDFPYKALMGFWLLLLLFWISCWKNSSVASHWRCYDTHVMPLLWTINKSIRLSHWVVHYLKQWWQWSVMFLLGLEVHCYQINSNLLTVCWPNRYCGDWKMSCKHSKCHKVPQDFVSHLNDIFWWQILLRNHDTQKVIFGSTVKPLI